MVEMEASLFEIIYLVTAVVSISSLSITPPGDVVAGRPFTLECRITRREGDRNPLAWLYLYNHNSLGIYSSRECNSPTSLLPESPTGLSGGCQHANNDEEEVYTVTIQNVTEHRGRGQWICSYQGQDVHVTLDVKVMVSGVTLAKPPDTVLAGVSSTFTCVTSASKPKACVRGYIRSSGNVREIDPHVCNQDASSVQTTTRTLTFTASAEENGAELYCNASNSVTDPPVRSQVYTLSVQYPPHSGVSLSGYMNNTAVESGETLTLTCQVGKGNPRPALTWSSGCGQTNPVPGNDGSQETSISITVNASLNQKTCVCKGSQNGSLTGWTEQRSRTFNVLFGPDSVQLRADSDQSGNTVTVTENSKVTFTCNTSESNTAAVLSWYNNISPIAGAEISEVTSPRGPNHGYLTTQRYSVRVDRYQDGHVIRCEAQRPGNGGSNRVSSNLTLNVTYEPMFTSCKSSYIFVENGTAEISCTTWAKPQPTITWSRGAQPSDVSVTNHRYTSVVRFSRISRTDSGVYTVTASNTVRSGVERIVNLTVYYPPNVSVVLVSGKDVTEGNALRLECHAEAVPQNYTYSVWSRTIGDIPLPLSINSQGRYLSINQTKFGDQGVYRCGASNGFGGVQGGQLEVNVRAPPQFPRQINPQAAALVETRKLEFRFLSYPAYVNLTWYKLTSNMTNGTPERLVVSNTTGSKYRSHVKEAEHEFMLYDTKVLLSGHVAELEISDVKRDDFGEYKLVAENDVGSSAITLSFILIDRPFPPSLTTVICENRVANVTWISGFNGGSTQIFKFQYKKKGDDWIVLPNNITDPGENMTVSQAVVDLQEEIEYSFSVYGVNRWNKSELLETSCTVKVLPSALAAPLAGGISGAIVLLGVVLLAVVVFRRRKQESRSSEDTEKMRPGDVSSGVRSTRHYENITSGVESSSSEQEPTPSAGRTGAYEEVDLVPNSSPSGPPIYSDVNKPLKAPKPTKVSGRGTPTYAEVNKSQKTNKITTAQPVPIYAEVNKAKKISETAQAPEGPVYAEVNKTQKKINEKTASEGPVYAEVNKTEKKANEKKGAFGKAKGMFKGKQKGKPTDKTGLINGKAKSGNGQISVDTFANAAFAGDEVTYSNSGDVDSMEQSGRAGQMKGPPDLVYADMDFAGTNPIVHPAQNATTYASIAFGQVGPPVVYDTDEDDGNPKSSEGKA